MRVPVSRSRLSSPALLPANPRRSVGRPPRLGGRVRVRPGGMAPLVAQTPVPPAPFAAPAVSSSRRSFLRVSDGCPNA